MRRIRAHPQILAFLIAFVFGGEAAYTKTVWELVCSAISSGFVSITLAKPQRAAMIVAVGMVYGTVTATLASSEQTTLTAGRILIAIGVSVIAALIGPLTALGRGLRFV